MEEIRKYLFLLLLSARGLLVDTQELRPHGRYRRFITRNQAANLAGAIALSGVRYALDVGEVVQDVLGTNKPANLREKQLQSKIKSLEAYTEQLRKIYKSIVFHGGTRNKKLSRKLSLLRAKSNAEIAALAREFGLQEGQNLILEEADCSGEREEDCETLQVLIMDVNEQDNDDVQDETT